VAKDQPTYPHGYLDRLAYEHGLFGLCRPWEPPATKTPKPAGPTPRKR